MRRSARVVTAVLGAGAGLVLSATAALAQTATDAYSGVESGTDTRSGGTGVGSGTGSGAGTLNASSAPTTLPFTGGEATLVAGAGAGALLTGVALVAAGRRRTSPDLPA